MNNSYNALRNIASFRNTGKSQPISGIELMIDDKNMYFAGNDDGYVMTIDCPYGTQEMANDLLAKAQGFEYQGFTAEQVILPPETELGDGVTVAGVYGMVARRSFKFTPGMTSNIEAPRELEVQHEYKYSSPQQRKTERQIAETRSLITKTAEEIKLEIQGVDGRVSSLQLTLDGVTITGSDGVTRIKGGMIQANSVTATQIDATNLKVAAANITGTLTASQIQASSIYVGDLADGSSYATKTYVQNNAGLSASEVDDAIATYIDGTSITAETLRGRTVELLASSNTAIGSMELVDTTTGYGVAINTSYGGIKLSSGGNVYISSYYGSRLQLDGDAAKIGPTVWATDGTVIYSSDKNVKNSIEYDLSRYRQFLLDLKPCRFKYNEGQSGRYHIGMIAQDMEKSLAENGLTPMDFSGWCKMPIRNENHEITGYTYGIRYDTLIPLNTMMIQELVKRLDAVETKLEGIA